MCAPELMRELEFAVRTARRAGTLAQRSARRPLTVQVKEDATRVTDADLRVEAMVRKAITTEFPADAILGEEGGREGDRARCWIIDPIDATENFIAAIPIWATLIALQIGGRGVVGVANAPALGELYAAAAGAGATLNGTPIHVSDTADVEQARLLESGLDELLASPWAQPYLALTRRSRRSRGFGDFWGHLLVARGAADAVIEPTLRSWDFAALEVIVSEAGGRMTTIDGAPLRDGGSVLTTNPRLHDQLVAALGWRP